MLSLFNDFHMTVSEKTGIIRKYQETTILSILTEKNHLYVLKILAIG